MTEKAEFTVIAHRGASGYLPEHTLESVTLAHAMGVDFIEQDVVLTRDNHLVVLHDLFLETMTDVRQRYPGRQRDDSHYYAIDFDLREIQALQVHERLNPDGSPAFPGRFPADRPLFTVPTFAEEISLIQGLNETMGRQTGLYVEPKSPAWHSREGRDIMAEVIRELAAFGYQSENDRAYLQSFDMKALKRARRELQTNLKLVQLIGENSWRESDSDCEYLRSPRGLAEIKGFANGIGPWLPHLIDYNSNNSPDISDLVACAHQNELFVHAYTLRADQLPSDIGSIAEAMGILTQYTELDGIFTDHPDQALDFLKRPG